MTAGPGCLHLSIDYDESEEACRARTPHRGVVLRRDGEEVLRVATGDVVADYRTAMSVAASRAKVSSERIMLSSSVDHFVMDHEGYRWSTDPELGDVILREGVAPMPPI